MLRPIKFNSECSFEMSLKQDLQDFAGLEGSNPIHRATNLVNSVNGFLLQRSQVECGLF